MPKFEDCRRKATGQLYDGKSKLTALFFLKELTHKLRLFKLNLLTDIALKMNKPGLPFQYLLSVIKLKFSSKNSNIGKVVSANVSWYILYS